MNALTARSALPAIAGGEPIRPDFLHFSKPSLSENEISSVVETLKSGWLTTASKAKEFEDAFCAYTGAKHAVSLNSCTAGLFLSLKALDIGPGDEVLTTPLTFVASVNIIEHAGAKPVFADIDPETSCISPDGVRDAVTPDTKAILPVHLYGHPCEIGAIEEIADSSGISIIHDCAHAVETEFNGCNIGRMRDIACYSFYATKNITTGEGGMLTTNIEEIADKIRMMALHGLDKSAYSRYEDGGRAGYDVAYPGYKFNMPDILAALGVEGLNRLEERYNRRDAVWNMYLERLSEIPGLLLPPEPDKNHRHARHLFACRISPETAGFNRDDLLKALNAENIGTGIHFQAVHTFSYYRDKYGFDQEDFPYAHEHGTSTFSLPLTPYLTDKDVEDVIEALTRIFVHFASSGGREDNIQMGSG